MSARFAKYLSIVAVCLLAFACRATELAAASDSAIESGHDALGSKGKFPWYDADRDTLRPIPLLAAPPRNREPAQSESITARVRTTAMGTPAAARAMAMETAMAAKPAGSPTVRRKKLRPGRSIPRQ